jgi:hypothetical protein
MYKALVALLVSLMLGCQVRPAAVEFNRIEYGTGDPINDVVESFGSQTFISSRVKSQPGFVGLVTYVQAFVDAEGVIKEMRIWKSSGNAHYDRLATEYMQSWTFKKREVCRAHPCNIAVPILLER